MSNTNGFPVLNDEAIQQYLSDNNEYSVIKESDIKKYLSDKERFALNHLLSVIAIGRESDNQTNANEYLVINTNEPYVDKLVTIIKQADAITSNERFINRQIDFYLNENPVDLTGNEIQQLKTAMWYRITGGSPNGSWQFNAETFRFDISLAIDTIKQNRGNQNGKS